MHACCKPHGFSLIIFCTRAAANHEGQCTAPVFPRRHGCRCCHGWRPRSACSTALPTAPIDCLLSMTRVICLVKARAACSPSACSEVLANSCHVNRPGRCVRGGHGRQWPVRTTQQRPDRCSICRKALEFAFTMQAVCAAPSAARMVSWRTVLPDLCCWDNYAFAMSWMA